MSLSITHVNLNAAAAVLAQEELADAIHKATYQGPKEVRVVVEDTNSGQSFTIEGAAQTVTVTGESHLDTLHSVCELARPIRLGHDNRLSA